MADADVRVICGPTAAGKSAVAMWLASQHEIAIVSADSRAIYRGFDIGTAKPTSDERSSVEHFGVDVAEPTERFSAARWADAADRWIDDIRASGRTPVVVGGTGFYLRALFDPLFDEPALDDARRIPLQRELERFGNDELRRWANMLDPERAQLGRTQLLRAIEIALLTGHRLSDLHQRSARPPRRTARYLLVDPGAALASRIAARVTSMFDNGWTEEVERLVRRVTADAPAWNASGYGTVRDFVEGRSSRDEAMQKIVIETRQYAKRQRTWFRHQLPPDRVTHLDPDQRGWQDRVEEWWESTASDA